MLCCLCAVGCGCRTQAQHEFSVFWVPRRSIAVERVLEDEGVYGEVTQVGTPELVAGLLFFRKVMPPWHNSCAAWCAGRLPPKTLQ